MDADQSQFESFAWIDIALTGAAYDPEVDLVFALDHARVIPAAHAEHARRYLVEWGPFTTSDDIAAAANVVAKKCGGRVDDLTVLLTHAAQMNAFPEGRRLSSSEPSLEGILAYLSRYSTSEWPRVVTAIHRRAYSRMRSEEELLMALLTCQLERGAARGSQTHGVAR